MIYTIFTNLNTNEKILILEGNDDKNLICSISNWDIIHTKHEHFETNYTPIFDDDELHLINKQGLLISKYKILSRLENGKNIYDEITKKYIRNKKIEQLGI